MNNREKWSKFYPKFVYRCPCLGEIIQSCYEKDFKSFLQIHDEMLINVLENGLMVFTAKCGENLKDVIFCCEQCSGIMVFGKKKFDCTVQPGFETLRLQLNPEDPEKNFCKYCVEKYLRETFFYFKSLEFI